jgi:hypothetical protein
MQHNTSFKIRLAVIPMLNLKDNDPGQRDLQIRVESYRSIPKNSGTKGLSLRVLITAHFFREFDSLLDTVFDCL